MKLKRRTIIFCVFFLFLGFSFYAQQKNRLPNVVIILVDDAGYDDFNFMGSSNLETPNIDNIAKHGVIFTDAHVTSTVCAPSRAGLITGRYQQRDGFECNSPPKGLGLKASLPTFGKLVQNKGYKTIAIGKWHVGETSKLHPNNMGFQEFYGFLGGGHDYFRNYDKMLHNNKGVEFKGYLTDVFGNKAVEYIEEYKNQPFLMYFAPNAVHTPMQAKKEYLAKFKGHPRKELAAMVWSLDENVGRIYKKLKKEKLLENTLIFFLSDNGGAIGNQSSNSPYTSLESSVLKGWKGNEFEGGHRIPFFMSWKGRINEGKWYKGLTSSLDIFATIDAVSNEGSNSSLLTQTDGVNLLPFLLGNKKDVPHKQLFWRYDQTVSMRYKNYKLIRLKDYDYRLYNLDSDLKERIDVSESRPKLARRLLKKIERWETSLSAPLWKDRDDWRQVTVKINKALMNNEKPKNYYPKEMKKHKVKTLKASLWNQGKDNLGEGPIWMESTKDLLWVDIGKGLVKKSNVNTNRDEIIYHGESPSCILAISEFEFIIADKNKLIRLNKENKKQSLYLKIEFKDSNIRFNDGKVDPNGNLWIGTMDMDVTPNKGSLYRIDSDKNVSEVLQSVTISNGLAWSLDAKTMYYIDTADNVVYAFDFNDKSEISNKRIAFRIPMEMGAPDGMTIDSNGNIWIALWGGHAVVCWNPKSGRILRKIEVNAPNVTSCTFGGKNMNTLFITTARTGLLEKELKKYPNSGSVFTVKTDVHGFNPNYFQINLK